MLAWALELLLPLLSGGRQGVTPDRRFSSLLPEHSFLQEFLSRDPCFQISDKVRRGHSGGRGWGHLGKVELVGFVCC